MTIRDRNLHPNAGSRVNSVVATITSAQILALNATPITIVPAPGAGFTNIFEGAVIQKPAGTAYTIGTNVGFAVKYTNGAGLDVGAIVAVAGFIDQATTQTRFIRARSAAMTAGTESGLNPVENAVLVLQALTAAPTAGTSPFVLKVYFRTVPMVPDTGVNG